MLLRDKLVQAMREAGYVTFSIRPDSVNSGTSVITVYQTIKNGFRPAFWRVIECLHLDGAYGTQFYHQIKTTEIPAGTYLTFSYKALDK
jgi:hypothetical protein